MNALAFPISRAGRGIAPVIERNEAIETRRLILRRPAEDDIVAMTALADNIRIATKLPDMPHPYTISDAGRFIRRLRDRSTCLTGFVITEADTGTLIGCGKLEAGETDSETRIGLWVGEAHWNKGNATEAAQALVDHAFSRSPRLIGIRASVAVMNPAARRVLEKCGFQYASPGAEMDIRMGCMVPVDHYQIDRGIWSAVKAWSQTTTRRLAG
jgi:RimJ/RimL family protein N-acetyltransferase